MALTNDPTLELGITRPQADRSDDADVPHYLRAQAADIETLLLKAGARSGKSINPGENTRAAGAAFGVLGTPDVVSNLKVAEDGLIFVYFRFLWKKDDPAGIGGAVAIYLDEEKVKVPFADSALLLNQSVGLNVGDDNFSPAASGPGAALGYGATQHSPAADSTIVGAGTGTMWSGGGGPAQPIVLEADPGTYDVSLRFSGANAGLLRVKERRLHAWTKEFPD